MYICSIRLQRKRLRYAKRFVDSHLHPACISHKSLAMRLQAGLEAAPDFMLYVPILRTSGNAEKD